MPALDQNEEGIFALWVDVKNYHSKYFWQSGLNKLITDEYEKDTERLTVAQWISRRPAFMNNASLSIIFKSIRINGFAGYVPSKI